MAEEPPVLYLIVCGAPPTGAEELPELVRHLRTTGWDVCVVATRIGRRFVDVPALEELTGHPVREDYKHPDEPDVLPPPDVVVCAPATFNTVNKLAAGISDTLPLGLLNEALGGGLPVVVAPWTNKPLAGHPAFGRSVQFLRAAGVRFVPDTEDLDLLVGAAAGNPFPWTTLRRTIRDVGSGLRPGESPG